MSLEDSSSLLQSSYLSSSQEFSSIPPGGSNNPELGFCTLGLDREAGSEEDRVILFPYILLNLPELEPASRMSYLPSLPDPFLIKNSSEHLWFFDQVKPHFTHFPWNKPNRTLLGILRTYSSVFSSKKGANVRMIRLVELQAEPGKRVPETLNSAVRFLVGTLSSRNVLASVIHLSMNSRRSGLSSFSSVREHFIRDLSLPGAYLTISFNVPLVHGYRT